MLKLGRHVSIAGSMDRAFDRAVELNSTAMQIFVTNPRGWAMSYLDKGSESEFVKKRKSTGIVSVAHMPYLPNIASLNDATYSKSVDSLKDNLARCDALGVEYLVTHMGSHLGKGKQEGLKNVADAVSAALDRKPSSMILLENEAGHKNSVGDEIEDLVKVYDAVNDRKLGFCLDTCHLFAAGYDITKHSALDDMFGVLGMDKVFAIHLNDAKKELGSHLDRHANIGLGHIGVEGFRNFLNYRGIASKTIVLETPLGPEISEGDEIALVRNLIEN